MTNTAFRARYLTDTIDTASPARLVVMLYDRLVLDLVQAEAALRAGDRLTGGQRLVHAQEVVLELRGGLDLSAWSGAAGLDQLYGFLYAELVGANVAADPDRTAAVRALVEPLADAWRQAAATTASAVPAERVG